MNTRAGLLIVALVLLALAGCAEIPECPGLSVKIMETEDGRFFILDEANWFGTLARQRALQDGRCKLRLPTIGSST